MTTRATLDQMEDLHGIVVESIVDDVRGYRADGKPVPPQLFACANKILKHNGVDTPARAVRSGDALARFLPEFEEDL